jgi:hypothetical protein
MKDETRDLIEDEINRILDRGQDAPIPTEDIEDETETPLEPTRGLSKKQIEIKEKELKIKEKELDLEEAKSKRKDILLKKFIDGEITAKQLESLLKLI